MNYLRSFLEEKKRAKKPLAAPDKTDETSSVSFVSESLARSSTSFSPSPPGQDRQRWPEAEKEPSPERDRAAWTLSVTPDARQPLLPVDVRAKIESIEAEARRLGWPAELLWNGGFWDSPRGVAAVLDADDEIAEVTPEYIAILKTKRDLLRFRRHAA